MVVSLGVTTYLPRTLQGLAAQTTAPDAVLVVDVTAGPDPGHGRASTLRAAAQEAGIPLERVRVGRAPGAATFGDAVRQGLVGLADQGGGGAGLAGSRWLWLLHDDSPPQAAALAELLRSAKAGPTIAVTGAKQRDWDAPEHLLELGVTATPTGRRFLGFDEGELDQGQYDDRVDVYAVGTAGALVLTSVWHELGGTDPALGPFGDGFDLCRRARLAGYRVVVAPRAVVLHKRAAYRGLRTLRPGEDRRRTDADIRRSFRARRAAHLHTRAVHAATWALPLFWLAVVAFLPVRVLARVATKEFRLAGDEVAALVAVAGRPGAVRRARVLRRRSQRVPQRRLRPLRATMRQAWRLGHERRMQAAAARRGRLVRSELEVAERAALAARRRWTAVALVAALAVLAGVAYVPLLATGALTGGALLPSSAGVGELWQRAVGSWSPTADGYPGPADPFGYVLTGLTALSGGSARTAATVLVLLAVPLAGLGAWFAAGAATRSVRLRAWAAVVWAVAPPLVIGVGQGRLGPVVAHLALPWAALGIARALGVHREDRLPSASAAVVGERGGSVAAASAAGLALALAAAGAPALLLPALLTLLLLAVLVVRRRRAMLLLVALPPVVLLAPLLLEAAADLRAGSWRILAADPGVPFAATPGSSLDALLGWPTAPVAWPLLPEPAAQLAPVVVAAVLVLAAVLALVRRRDLRTVRAGWLVLVVGLAAALAAGRVDVGVGTGVDDAGPRLVRGWSGSGTSLVVLGVVIAVVAAADGLVRRLTSSSFGLRQVAAAVLAVVLVVAPVTAGLAWTWQSVEARTTPGAQDVLALTGRGTSPVPALGAELQRPPQEARVLALAPADGEVVAKVWRGDGDQLHEVAATVSVRPLAGAPTSAVLADPDPAEAHLAELAAGLALGTSGDVRAPLAQHAVGVVVVPAGSGDARDTLVARLDATAGLERVTENSTGVVWRVAPEVPGLPVSRVRVEDEDGRVRQALASDGVVAGGVIEPAGRTGDGGTGRLVVLAERADPGWRAWLDGRELRSTSAGWRQAFALPEGGGVVTVTHQSWPLTLVHSAQAVVLGVLALLALPLRRRRAGVG